MSLREEIADGYMDADRLVSPRRCDANLYNASGNGVLYSSIYIVLLASRGELKAEDMEWYTNAIEDSMDVPGLLKRSPHGEIDRSPDDYIGLAAGASLCNPGLAYDVIKYGWAHKGMFGPPSLRSFLPRQPQLVALYYWAARRKPFFLLRAYTAFVILISCLFKPTVDTDSRMLTWLMIQAIDGRSAMCNFASRIWLKRLAKHYLNGMQDVAKIEFPSDHPFTRYFPLA